MIYVIITITDRIIIIDYKYDNYDLKNQNNISFSNDYTKVDHNQKEGIFSELFNNIGQVKPN